ncbi:MAG: hypothetical protein HGB00_03830 [Chlorobiaceae bacterium]|nr:hypothetical protein [Chlorobiaceae bacterium]
MDSLISPCSGSASTPAWHCKRATNLVAHSDLHPPLIPLFHYRYRALSVYVSYGQRVSLLIPLDESVVDFHSAEGISGDLFRFGKYFFDFLLYADP